MNLVVDLAALALGIGGVAWGLVSRSDRGALAGARGRLDPPRSTGGPSSSPSSAAWRWRPCRRRFGGRRTLALFGAYFVALVLLLATDLDQRLLPDVITLPAIPIAFVAAATGLRPARARASFAAAVAVAVGLPLLLFVLSVPFGAGAIGIGDLKLLFVAWGCSPGSRGPSSGSSSGAFLAGVVVLVLLVTRRVRLRSYIPFGPFLIIGAMWGSSGRAESQASAADGALAGSSTIAISRSRPEVRAPEGRRSTGGRSRTTPRGEHEAGHTDTRSRTRLLIGPQRSLLAR